jgi:amidase
MTDELWRLDGVALGGLIRSGKVSARESVTAHLEWLDAVNPRLNAVVAPFQHEQALRAADEADRRRLAGETLGILHGLPVTTKINSDQAGLPTDNGSPKYKDLIIEVLDLIRMLRPAGAAATATSLIVSRTRRRDWRQHTVLSRVVPRSSSVSCAVSRS